MQDGSSDVEGAPRRQFDGPDGAGILQRRSSQQEQKREGDSGTKVPHGAMLNTRNSLP